MVVITPTLMENVHGELKLWLLGQETIGVMVVIGLPAQELKVTRLTKHQKSELSLLGMMEDMDTLL